MKKNTDHRESRDIFYNFYFSCEAVDLLISLKLDNFNPSLCTHIQNLGRCSGCVYLVFPGLGG